MPKYILTNRAIKDLSDIWNYTFDNWSERQADRYYKILLEGCHEISKRPNIGKKYDKVINGLLGYKTGHHIIFYNIESNTNILIIRILHEQMDLGNRIKT